LAFTGSFEDVRKAVQATDALTEMGCDVIAFHVSLIEVWREAGGRLEGGGREAGGRLEGGWREAGGRLEGGWREDGGRMEGEWREAGGRLEGGWREDGGRLEGGWREAERLEGGWEAGGRLWLAPEVIPENSVDIYKYFGACIPKIPRC
jgi:hypothetical protein